MSVTSRSPLRMAGANIHSGSVDTGEFMHVRGGGQAATIYSGAFGPALTGVPGGIVSGGNVLIFSGGGRLNSVLVHQNVLALSGVAISFYDAGVIKLSGVSIAASGAKVLGVVGAAGGVSGQFNLAQNSITLDSPFQSGLCVEALSGAPGFTTTWTPERVT